MRTFHLFVCFGQHSPLLIAQSSNCLQSVSCVDCKGNERSCSIALFTFCMHVCILYRYHQSNKALNSDVVRQLIILVLWADEKRLAAKDS